MNYAGWYDCMRGKRGTVGRVEHDLKNHRVTVGHSKDRVRAVCCCGWRSPWVTAEVKPDEDVPPRPAIEKRAVRAAQWHIRTAATA